MTSAGLTSPAWSRHHPWRAPGSAPVFDPCGMAGGGPKQQGGEAKYTTTKFAKQGDLGTKVLPPAPTGIVWPAGGIATTKWSIRANHGVSSWGFAGGTRVRFGVRL